MNAQPELERLVADWLQADAGSAGSDRVLAATLARVAVTRQDRHVTQRLFGDRLGRSQALRWGLVAAALAIALLGAIALAGGQPPRPTPPTSGAFAPGPRLLNLGGSATLLADGRVFVVGGGSDIPPIPDMGQVWDPRDRANGVGPGSFAFVGSPIETRIGQSATLLSDGRVLIVGRGTGTLGTAETWDPVSGSFAPAGRLARPRAGHTATLLSDGRVLLVGGFDDTDGSTATAEIWDPGTGSSSPTGALAEPRAGQSATLLRDGRVLIVGGTADDSRSATAEIWDPATGSFSPTGSLAEARASHTATLLPDGRVLVIGGENFPDPSVGSALATSEVWDPVTQRFSPTGRLTEARTGHSATLLPDGRVLVIGGATTELWDPATESFHKAGSMADALARNTATLLPDGRVLVIGLTDAAILELRRLRQPVPFSAIWDPTLPPSFEPRAPGPALTPPPVAAPEGG